MAQAGFIVPLDGREASRKSIAPDQMTVEVQLHAARAGHCGDVAPAVGLEYSRNPDHVWAVIRGEQLILQFRGVFHVRQRHPVPSRAEIEETRPPAETIPLDPAFNR